MSDSVHADMLVGDLIDQHPNTIKVFVRYGLHCVGCPISRHHTIARIALENNLDLEQLLSDLVKGISDEKDGH